MTLFRNLKKWKIKNKLLADLISVSGYKNLKDFAVDIDVDLRSLERYIYEGITPSFEIILRIFRVFSDNENCIVENEIDNIDKLYEIDYIDKLYVHWGIRNKVLIKEIINKGFSIKEFSNIVGVSYGQVLQWIIFDTLPRTNILLKILKILDSAELYGHWKINNVELVKEIIEVDITFNEFCELIDKDTSLVRRWIMGTNIPIYENMARVSRLFDKSIGELFNLSLIDIRKSRYGM